MRFRVPPSPRVTTLQRVGWIRLTVALVALGLLLFGCSPDADDEPTPTDPDTSESDAGVDDRADDDTDDPDEMDDPDDPAEVPDDPADAGDDGADTPDEQPGDGGGQDDAGQDDVGQDPPAPPVSPGPAGIVTIDGQGIAMQEARRCASMDAQNIERDLDLQVIGEGGDGRVQLDIVVEEAGGMPRQALTLTLADGRVLANDAQDLGSGWEDQRQQAMSGPPIEVAAGTARVDWVVYDPVGGQDELAVRVEVDVPATTTACR